MSLGLKRGTVQLEPHDKQWDETAIQTIKILKSILGGDFHDAIYNCPFEMHELVTDEDISKAILTLKDVQKELLYLLAIQGYSCQMIAAFRKQTDRNIRKIRDTMLKKIRKSFIQALQNRIDNHIPLTKAEINFYDTYQTLITDKKESKDERNLKYQLTLTD